MVRKKAQRRLHHRNPTLQSAQANSVYDRQQTRRNRGVHLGEIVVRHLRFNLSYHREYAAIADPALLLSPRLAKPQKDAQQEQSASPPDGHNVKLRSVLRVLQPRARLHRSNDSERLRGAQVTDFILLVQRLHTT